MLEYDVQSGAGTAGSAGPPPPLAAADPSAYLGADDVVQSGSPEIVRLAGELREKAPDDVAFTRAAYEWVRDEVTHSVDAEDPTVTVTATEVLAARTGLCYAKSHLLAALLRAQGIPTGLCYQRLADGSGSHVLHGLVAVHLDGGWHRLDPRGNNANVDAQFSLGSERVAFVADPAEGEVDYPDILVRPAPPVLAALRGTDDVLELCRTGLPSALDSTGTEGGA
jgi:transglutaminase-like putative cysteine protease